MLQEIRKSFCHVYYTFLFESVKCHFTCVVLPTFLWILKVYSMWKKRRKKVLYFLLEHEQVVLSSNLRQYTKGLPDSFSRCLFLQTSQSHDSFVECFIRWEHQCSRLHSLTRVIFFDLLVFFSLDSMRHVNTVIFCNWGIFIKAFSYLLLVKHWTSGITVASLFPCVSLFFKLSFFPLSL